MNTRSVLRSSVVAMAACLATTAAFAQAPATRTADEHAAAIELARDLVQAVMKQSRTPGMSVAVGIDGEVVWAEGFGYADLEHRVPVWEETLFRIGSVSKPVTAFAVGLLVEQGKLDLDAPVQEYVSTFPEKKWPISTRQAAGHLAGIRHYKGGEFLSSKYYATVEGGLTIFQDDELLFEPGTKFSYSSYGWNLVSAVVEGASGEPFLSYMQREVFERLGMNHTVADQNSQITPHRTSFYGRAQDGRITNAPYVDNSYKWAGGGFLSTPTDLLHFAFAHFGTETLGAATIAELWTPLETADGESTGYGIGWSLELEDGKVVEAGHGGGSIGGTTGFVTYPQQRAVVAITGNMSGAPTGGLLPHLILEAFLDPSLTAARPPGPELSGTYSCTVGEGEDANTTPLVLLGEPGAYWGRVGGFPIVRVWSGPSETRIVAPTARGSLIGATFDRFEDGGIYGHAQRGDEPVRCERN